MTAQEEPYSAAVDFERSWHLALAVSRDRLAAEKEKQTAPAKERGQFDPLPPVCADAAD